MKEIELHGKNGVGRVALVDDDMFEYMNQFRWYIKKCPTSEYVIANIPLGLEVEFRVYETKNQQGYVTRKTYMHWIVMSPPKDLMVDHINRDTLDNRRDNLRIVTRVENRRNSRDIIFAKKYQVL